MTEKQDAGPAFPFAIPREMAGRFYMGMSLRDWFAGQALVVLAGNPPPLATQEERRAYLAEACYRVADAMIAERNK